MIVNPLARQWLFRQKYKFDLGGSWMSIVNLSLLVIASGDKLTTLLGLPTRILVVLIVPCAIFSVWLVGFLMDRYLKMAECYNREANSRNELLTEILERVRKMEGRHAAE